MLLDLDATICSRCCLRETDKDTALCFWPGGEAAISDAMRPWKAWEESPGKASFPHGIFPAFLGQKPLTFVTLARQADVAFFTKLSNFAYWSPEDEVLWRRSGRAERPAFPLLDDLKLIGSF